MILGSLLALLASGCATPPESRPSPFARFGRAVVEDHRYAYQREQVSQLIVPLGVAGTLANTNADRSLRDRWQDNRRNDFTNDVGRLFRYVGDAGQNRVSIPLYGLGMLAGGYSGEPAQDSPLAVWASHSLRANILGGIQAGILAHALGSPRPPEGESDWNPGEDDNGVSGHAFYGAVPLLTAGHMTNSDGWRYTLYTLSTLPALSRINNDKHYTSQVVMGWSIAWLSTTLIADRTQDSRWQVQLLPTPSGARLMFRYSL